MKKTIKLTESKLHEIIMEAARNMIQESYAEARPNSQRLIDLIDEGVIDVKSLAYSLIDWMDDDEIGRFAKSEGYFEDEDLEDEEEEEEEEEDEDAIDFY